MGGKKKNYIKIIYFWKFFFCYLPFPLFLPNQQGYFSLLPTAVIVTSQIAEGIAFHIHKTTDALKPISVPILCIWENSCSHPNYVILLQIPKLLVKREICSDLPNKEIEKNLPLSCSATREHGVGFLTQLPASWLAGKPVPHSLQVT